MDMDEVPDFKTIEDAAQWMDALVDDNCMDNHRFAFTDDNKAMDQYNEQCSTGCCGSFDSSITINGRKAVIGCNYGH